MNTLHIVGWTVRFAKLVWQQSITIMSCGGCPEMKSCEKVGAIIGNNPDARDRLENAGSV